MPQFIITDDIDNFDNSIICNSTANYLKQSQTQEANIINTDFEWPKISAIEKGLKVIHNESSKLITIDQDSVTHDNYTILNSTVLTKLETNDKQKDENSENDSSSPNKNIKRCKIVFSSKKLLLENELLRRDNVKKEIDRKKEEMENFTKHLKHHQAIMRTILAQKRQEDLQKINRRFKVEEESMNEKIKQSEINRKREQQLRKQKVHERMKELEHEQLEYMKTMREKEELLEKIQPYPIDFKVKCENINMLNTSCKDRNSAAIALSAYYPQLKDCEYRMNIIQEKTQAGNITINDLQIAEDVIRHTDEVLKQYSIETERINSAFDAEIARREYAYQQAELQLQASQFNNIQLQQTTTDQVDDTKQLNVKILSPLVENQSQPADTTPQKDINSQDDLQSIVNPELWLIYTHSQEYLEQYQSSHSDFLHNDELKKFRFDCQKAIITPVNAINAINREHLTDKYNRVMNFLTGKLAPNVKMHPQGLSFSIYMLAKKIVSQGETLVSSKPEMAFSIASFTIAIWNEYQEFGDMLLAHFRTICPYTIPLWLPQLESSTNDFNNLKKHSGILRLYASIIVSKQRQGVTKSHPHGLGNAWKWLAATLNIEPRVDTAEIMATLILDMLEVVGHFMLSTYPKQFPKMLNVLRLEYFPKLKSLADKNAGGPVSRLEEFLQQSIASGAIPPPTGLLPPNYW